MAWVASGPAAAQATPALQIVAELERGEHPGFEAFLLQTEGELTARFVSPALANRPPDLRSATKSITALLIGVAIDRGLIPNVRARAAEWLPDYRATLSAEPRKSAITIEDLLTMRSGLACDDWSESSPGHEDRMYETRDWLAFWASRPMERAPGEQFSYCTGNVVALGEILAVASGVDAERFAAEALFAPLGVQTASWAKWGKKRRIDTGGHLRLAPDDLLRVGQLVLDRGVYGGRRVVSEAWIDAMTRAHTQIPGRAQQYGYLWWVDRTRAAHLPATELWWAQGNGGTVLMVMPSVRSVMVVTGVRFNRPDAAAPMFWLRDRLLPAMRGASPTE